MRLHNFIIFPGLKILQDYVKNYKFSHKSICESAHHVNFVSKLRSVNTKFVPRSLN